MIITCPDCTTRYDVDDDRFTPDGRSVRCTACGESWFVPAPEDIDVAPIEELSADTRVDDEDVQSNPKRGRSRLKVRIEDEEAPSAKAKSTAKARKPAAKKTTTTKSTAAKTAAAKSAAAKKAKKEAVAEETVDFNDDDEDDALFDTPVTASKAKANDKKPNRRNSTKDDEVVEKGWRQGRQFIVEDEEESRPFFSRKRKDNDEKAQKKNSGRKETAREALHFADHESDDFDDEFDADDTVSEWDALHEDDPTYEAGDATIVDADWEDVGDYEGRPRGFGRRVRHERRRATAVARMEDVRRFDPNYFDEEFFASLRVTPRELERAMRKARRRAESREKNRMTPWRAFGWSAWVAAVAGTIYAVVAYRDDIVRIAPKTADAYAVVGIEANPYGLEIQNVRHRLAMSTAGPTIEISGDLANQSLAAVDAPLLQAEALGPRGELLSRWTFSPAEVQVLPGEAVSFQTRAEAPEGVAEVALSFAPTKTVVGGLVQKPGE